MAFAGILVLVLAVTWFAIKSSYWAWKIIASVLWILMETFWVDSAPLSPTIAVGSGADIMFVAICWIIPVVLMTMPFWYEKNETGNQVARGFKVTINRLIGSDEAENRRKPTRQERNAAYVARIESAKRRYNP
jgi:hypothetical protein